MGFESSLCKLSELAHVNPRRPVTKGIEVPFIDMAALPLNGRDISPPDIRARLAKGSGARFQDGDTLVARITPCLENGKTAQVKGLGEGVVAEGSTEFIVLCGKNPLDNDFIYYLSRSPEFREFAISRMEGTSGRQRVVWQAIANYEFSLPPEDARRAAAEFLSIIDDRIEVLRQANATLEAIAQALFKSWFVDFDPVRAKAEGREPEGMDAATANLFSSELEDSELGGVPWGWKVQSLGSVAGNLREQAKPELLDPDTPYVGLEHMPRKSIALMDRGDAEGLASGKFWYSPCDILFGRLRPYFHKVGVAAEKGICSTDILVVRPHQPEWFGYCVGQFSSDALIAYATQVSNGARMPRVGWKDLAAYKVVTPPHDVAAAFDRLVRPMITRIHQNIEHARTLANVRDTLLPRLISGKLRLPNAEHEIEAATA